MPQRRDSALDHSFNSSSGSDSMESDSDEELAQIHTAIAPLLDSASPQELRQALAIAQKLLLNTCGRCRELLKRNALLETSASHGQKKLTANELALAVKEDTIKAHGRKYSMTHCLWIDMHLFPLRTCPNIDLSSKERWLSPLAIEDGVKAKLFLFIPETDHELMSHKNFGRSFAKGVNSVRSEMVSDVKSCAGAIFTMSLDIFSRRLQAKY
ncbi:uncharacterized protein F5891DRAFT_1189726 [Suillus fuscotomentosus]|uniref:Uncharacterized protein n=1 Tax=Suillus fuscotomentosus TaxID=1912939 RepID=A0AAD4E575_9AGAM|nr:uncharacterized protein F5891DRAFT_1189726 [Suillus fuscotomentosus]KAG1899567.1 hypothetical protein F5891DRAFT_1189726 [Suillus fuscotomentosus]